MSFAAVVIGTLMVKMATVCSVQVQKFSSLPNHSDLYFFPFFQKNRHMQKASFLLTENKCFPSAALSGINEKDLKQEQSADVILSMHHSTLLILQKFFTIHLIHSSRFKDYGNREDYDQLAQMCRLISVFPVCTFQKVHLRTTPHNSWHFSCLSW